VDTGVYFSMNHFIERVGDNSRSAGAFESGDEGAFDFGVDNHFNGDVIGVCQG